MITITMTEDEALNLKNAMNWWKGSGVNYWSQQWAEEMLTKLQEVGE